MDIKHRIDLNKLLPKNPVTVELGVAEGYFSEDILRDWKPSKHYAVDLWETHGEYFGDAGSPQDWHDRNYKAAFERLSKYPNCEILRGPTTRMQQYVGDNTVDLVSVDACHSLECVRDDIQAWWPKLKPGGIMAFHDYENVDYGVKQAVQEWADKIGMPVFLLPELKSEDAGAYIIKPYKNAN